MEQSLQRLLDVEAIKEVHLRYCRSIDRRDWDLLRSCYHADATDDHGDYVGGIDGFIEFCKVGTLTFESTTHFTGNQLVELDGDTAWAEHYAVAFHRIPASSSVPAKDVVCNARYVDRFERRNGEWRIAKRVIVVDSEREHPAGERWSNPVLYRGHRDKTDPSYSR